jgi:alginate O-acetyltransferase complex protein AlgI
MLFNSFQFLIFFPVVVALYFATPPRYRWLLLLIASYYFYMCWRASYALLLAAGTVVDYFAGVMMGRTPDRGKRRKYLLLSLLSNLGMLFTFKYFNFFMDSGRGLCDWLHWQCDLPTLRLLLPVGISFYTFQTLAYSIDVYRGRCPPERHFGRFAVYLAFWPQLVAGPIERPSHLLPQFRETYHFDYDRVTNGLKLMLWGFFKKVVIADNISGSVNAVYNNCTAHDGPALMLATVLFAYQIYCDFSGYSDIAVGAARVMGYDLMSNFRQPYQARSVGDFWRRWHISLSSWFRDYLYIPMGGNRVPLPRWYFNLFFTFLVSGLWHGANWTFVIWGALHGTYLLVGLVTERLRARVTAALRLDRVPRLHALLQQAVTFALVCFAWIFFRANSLSDAVYVVTHLFSGFGKLGLHPPNVAWLEAQCTALALGPKRALTIVAMLALLELVQYVQARCSVRELLARQPIWVRWPAYYSLIVIIALFGAFNRGQQFIYFQF